MARMVKMMFKIFSVFMLICLTSCISQQNIYERNIEKNAKEMMQCIVNEDVDGLFDYFNSDMKKEYANQSIDEIHDLLKYIDGKIISFDYKGSGGGEEAKQEGYVYYYNCYPKFEFTTDSNKTYTIEFSYHYIWDEHPEYEGVNMIFIRENDNYDTQLVIGRNYYK